MSTRTLYLLKIFFIVTSLGFIIGLSVYAYAGNNFSRDYLAFVYPTVSGKRMEPTDDKQTLSRHWQQSGSTEYLHVFSAYFKDDENIVQIVGIALIKTKLTCTCIFHPQNGKAVSINGTLEILPEHHGKSSSAVFIRCPLKNISNPSTVGLRVQEVITYLQVIYPSPRQYNFTVCIPCLHGPYRDPFRIIEMVETDLIFGADHFIVYNHSVSPEVDQVLRHYVKKGKMEVIQWNLPKVDVWYWGQIASLQDCNLASMHKSKYLVQKDVDELIVPHEHKNWHELMADLDRGESKYATYLFRNTFFRLDWPADTTGFKRSVSAKIMNIKSLLHVNRENHFFKAKVRTKSIVHPERVVISGIHFPWKITNGYSELDVDTKIAFLHHYRRWSGNTAKVKDEHMRQFADQLISNVNKRFKEIGYKYTHGDKQQMVMLLPLNIP